MMISAKAITFKIGEKVNEKGNDILEVIMLDHAKVRASSKEKTNETKDRENDLIV